MKSKKINEKKGLSARPTRATGAQARVLTGKRHKATANTVSGKRPGNSLPALYRKRSGVSLLLGLGIIFIMVFFSLLVSNVVVSSIRQSANVSRSNEAYFAAEGALEQGLLENFEKGAGYTSGNEPVTYDNTNLSANFQIQGTVPKELKYGDNSVFSGMYGVPTPGTGNAGANCDPNNPFIDKNFNFTFNSTTGVTTYSTVTSGGYDASEHPCNWNKIKTGETVTIPLYYEDENGDFVNLYNESNNLLKIRFRTACAGGHEFCIPTSTSSTTGHLRFENTSTEPKPQNDPIVTWQIEGLNLITGKTESLRPFINYDISTGELKTFSIFAESIIDGASGSGYNTRRHVVGEFITMKGTDLQNSTGCAWQFFGAPQTGVAPCNPVSPWANREIVKPVLKISVIGDLISARTSTTPITLTKIPHLEYQILTSANLAGGAPVNTSQTITAEGVSGTFKQVLQVNQPQAGGLPDYVVQQ